MRTYNPHTDFTRIRIKYICYPIFFQSLKPAVSDMQSFMNQDFPSWFDECKHLFYVHVDGYEACNCVCMCLPFVLSKAESAMAASSRRHGKRPGRGVNQVFKRRACYIYMYMYIYRYVCIHLYPSVCMYIYIYI